jgi:uncharacterized RDD family membrane protein YckC
MNMYTSMTTKLFRVVSIVVVGFSIAALYLFDIKQVGESEQWNDGKVLVTAGSHPVMLGWAFIAVTLYIALMRAHWSMAITGVPTLKRRAAAFLIDFWFSLMVFASTGAMIPLSLEAARTGHFSWKFERDYAVGTDWIATAFVLIFMVLMFLYFAFPLTKGRQTVGCFIMQLKVAPLFGNEGRFTFRGAARRTGYELCGLFTFWIWKGRRDDHERTWYDRKTGCRVVQVEYK